MNLHLSHAQHRENRAQMEGKHPRMQGGGDAAMAGALFINQSTSGLGEMSFGCLKSIYGKPDPGKGGLLFGALLGRLNSVFLAAVCGVLELQNFCSYSHLYSS